ncbi:MAG: biotin carboxylase, partial [Saprospiraceae bacterium]|nr:biotin carboxylase [Saprospiraceae bacterium]
PEVREAMGLAAVRVAQACHYDGSGTVEFLIDDQLNFYFLEMNTRLQVEHPVTELITGIDLVEQQIRIARGEKLSFGQEDLEIRGHAVELRVYAEDPLNDFLPSVGRLESYIRPTGDGIRLDDGYEQGLEIPIYYDPMIAKLVTYGQTRAEAIQRMIEAIDQYQIEGVATTLPFGKFVMEHPAFLEGRFDTGFVKKYFRPEAWEKKIKPEAELAARLALLIHLEEKKKLKAVRHATDDWRGY